MKKMFEQIKDGLKLKKISIEELMILVQATVNGVLEVTKDALKEEQAEDPSIDAFWIVTLSAMMLKRAASQMQNGNQDRITLLNRLLPETFMQEIIFASGKECWDFSKESNEFDEEQVMMAQKALEYTYCQFLEMLADSGKSNLCWLLAIRNMLRQRNLDIDINPD